MANLIAPQHSTSLERRRVLVVAADADRKPYLALRGPAPFRTWEVLEADSFEQAHFTLQMDHCDVLLLDGSVYSADDDSLSWLLAQHPLPTLLIAPADAAVAGLRQGAEPMAADRDGQKQSGPAARSAHPTGAGRRLATTPRMAGDALQDTRRQVSRLVSLLWEVTPATHNARWFPQRQMMERLYQETARCERHGGALSVVLGEMRSPARSRLSPEESHALATWTAERIGSSKRRCDVAGQYGPYGFMLLLPGSTNISAVTCCKRIQALLETPEAPVPQLQVYFGIGAFSRTNATIKALLTRAEERLEQALRGDGERVVA